MHCAFCFIASSAFSFEFSWILFFGYSKLFWTFQAKFLYMLFLGIARTLLVFANFIILWMNRKLITKTTLEVLTDHIILFSFYYLCMLFFILFSPWLFPSLRCRILFLLMLSLKCSKFPFFLSLMMWIHCHSNHWINYFVSLSAFSTICTFSILKIHLIYCITIFTFPIIIF